MAASYWKKRPWCVTDSPLHSRSISSSASSVRAPRAEVDRPVATHSGAPSGPTPNPGQRRPSLRTSRVAHCFASTRGSRNGTTTTSMPSRMRSVTPVRALRKVIASMYGSLEMRRSQCQIPSIPPSSQISTHFHRLRTSRNGNSTRPSPMRVTTSAGAAHVIGVLPRAASRSRSGRVTHEAACSCCKRRPV